MTKTPAIIFDIDGTLADITHRLLHIQKQPKDWDSFHAEAHKDTPYPLCMVAASLCEAFAFSESCAEPLFVTGRDDAHREQTIDWLTTHVHDLYCLDDSVLFMRPEGNREDDTIVKRRIYEEQIAPRYDVIAVFEDRSRVIRMWRELGLTVYDCNKTGGEF